VLSAKPDRSESSGTHRQLRFDETTLYIDGTVRAQHANAVCCGLSRAFHVAACVVETAHLPRLSSMDVRASTAKNLSKAALQPPFEPPTMSDWMLMEWIRGADCSWMRSPLDSDDATTSQTSWKDTARNLVGIRAIRRALLACLLIFVFANLFRLRVLRRFIPLDVMSPEQLLDGVNWSQYAYCQYVTNPHYLYNSVMIFEALDRIGAQASKVIMSP
jgi:hypothetical protein